MDVALTSHSASFCSSRCSTKFFVFSKVSFVMVVGKVWMLVPFNSVVVACWKTWRAKAIRGTTSDFFYFGGVIPSRIALLTSAVKDSFIWFIRCVASATKVYWHGLF